jgi:hypothetical protein
MMTRRRNQRVLALAALMLAAAASWTIPQTDAHQFRPNLQICVENLDGTPPSQKALGKITAAFQRVKAHPHFKDAQLDRGVGPTIVAGCPGEATITSAAWAGPKRGAPTYPETPSAFHTFVFVVPEAAAQQAFGTVFPRLTAQEVLCVDDGCGEVSTAAYITPAELDNADVLARSLSWGVGLIPPGEQLPTTASPRDAAKHTH